MKYKEFEKHIQSELGNSTMNVDIDKLIEQVHPVKNNKRLLFLLAGLFALSMTVLTTSLYSLNKDKVKKSETKKTMPDESRIITNSNKKSIVNSEKIIQKSLITNKQIPNSIDKNAHSQIINNSKNKNEILTSSTQPIKEKLNSKELNNKFEFRKDLLDEKYIRLSDKNLKNNANYRKFDFNFLDKRMTQLVHSKYSLPFKGGVKCFDFKSGAKWSWLIGAEIGLFKPLEQFELASGDANEVFDIRNKNEKPLEGIRAEVFGEVKHISFPLHLKLGVSYARITNQLQLKLVSTRIDTSFGIISITQSENGDTLTIIKGDIYKEVITERNIKSHYYIKHIDLPIGIGYDFNSGSFLFGVEAGAIVNIKTFTSGNILTTPNELNKVQDTNQFKSQIGLSYYGSFRIIKPVSYNTAIYLSTKFRYIPSSYTNSNSEFTQKYNFAGVNLGYLLAF